MSWALGRYRSSAGPRTESEGVAADLVEAREPGLAPQDVEEAHDGPVEPAEVPRVLVPVEAHPRDRVCPPWLAVL